MSMKKKKFFYIYLLYRYYKKYFFFPIEFSGAFRYNNPTDICIPQRIHHKGADDLP